MSEREIKKIQREHTFGAAACCIISGPAAGAVEEGGAGLAIATSPSLERLTVFFNREVSETGDLYGHQTVGHRLNAALRGIVRVNGSNGEETC